MSNIENLLINVHVAVKNNAKNCLPKIQSHLNSGKKAEQAVNDLHLELI